MRKVGLFTDFIYQVDENVDKILSQIMDEYELLDIKYNDEYTITLRFGNNILVEAWNSGRYYAWLSEGKVITNGKLFFTWCDGRPRRKTMNRLLELMNEMLGKKIKTIGNV